ncbi:MAG: MFS transporter [Anaerolineae bacterium]|nr:MFS transporter [Anaerolineae bacterium]
MKTSTVVLIVGFVYFLGLGMTGALFGVSWPSISQTFNLPVEALAFVTAASTGGFFVAGLITGQVLTRIGTGKMLLVGLVMRLVGTLGYGLAPSLWLFLSGAAILGMGSGLAGSAFNMYVVARHSPSRLNWMHAMFGIGATISPAAMAAWIESGGSWRLGYVVVAVFPVVLIAVVMLLLARIEADRVESAGASTGPSHISETLRLPGMWIGGGLFLLYTGVEVAGGDWSFTLFTQERGVDVVTAGTWVSVYWGAFMVGRVLLAFIADHVRSVTMLRGAMAGAIVASILIWWNPVNTVGFAGLALLGLSLAPIFAGLVTQTPGRVGPHHAANALGLQMSAAAVGAISLPGLAGFLAQYATLEVIGPLLVAGAILMFVLHEAGSRLPGSDAGG